MTCKIMLSDRLHSGKADDLIRLLAQKSGQDITIDGLKVLSVGARAAEILLRFQRFCLSSGHVFQIEASPDFVDDLRLMGMAEALLGGEQPL
ncbi:hypothetical protein SAMN04488040_1084 [Sulfitobacter marinus]|uniref:STAS domain-containing protein n=1 Tax=Sulfitobacter marinus TaxID=394264 RepID=A0A1I6QYU5_9RHOB|nr:hypothetical protein [Sulfitobacter marinus]SFS57584.1 hypothetical protein SAMN04488040_1084 [Sulfitobacter marinus]